MERPHLSPHPSRSARKETPQPGADGWIVEPFLHSRLHRFYNPLTDRTLEPDDPLFEPLQSTRADLARIAGLPPDVRTRLIEDNWLVRADQNHAARFRLLFVSLETHSLCNQSCSFCPVAQARRPAQWMPDALFASIVAQLAAYRNTVRAVFLNHYNEPTLDPRLPAQIRALTRHGLPAAFNTNGTRLTPALVDALAADGGLAFLSVNLSTLDPERYATERGSRLLARVLRNLDYAGDRPLAARMEIAVLGDGSAAHEEVRTQIARRFAASRFTVKAFTLCDRAGLVPQGAHALMPSRLAGCDQMGSRPIQHTHITPAGHCVLCCQDYAENYTYGDLTVEPLAGALSGAAAQRLRRWAYGLDDAPAGFICRRCCFAIRGPAGKA